MNNLPADDIAWDKVVSECYGLIQKNISTKQENLRLFKSRPGADFLANAPYLEQGGFTTADKNSFSLELIEKLMELLKREKLKYIQVKTQHHLNSIGENSILDTQYVTFHLDLGLGIETLWQEIISGKTRNQIRKGQKNLFSVKFGQDDLLNDFYTVISRCWRDLGTPTHSINFYRLILQHLGDKIRLCVLYDKNKPVSCALLIMSENTIHHPYAGTLNQYKPASANNVLYWSIIKFAIENCMTVFDMGRSQINSGTYKFKKSWGASPEPLYYYYFTNRNEVIPDYDSHFYTLATSAWKYMPLTLANMIGPRFIRNII